MAVVANAICDMLRTYAKSDVLDVTIHLESGEARVYRGTREELEAVQELRQPGAPLEVTKVQVAKVKRAP